MAAHAVIVGLAVLLLPPMVAGQEVSDLTSLASEVQTSARRALQAVVTVGGSDPVSPIASEGSFPTVSGGSGVVIDADRGLILTANSVVDDVRNRLGQNLQITLPDGRSRPVLDLRQDPASDLALLVIDPEGLDLLPLDWGSSESLEPGDLVMSIGNPWGLSGTVSLGIVSGLQRSFASTAYRDLIQTDALIAPGSAGGALVDRNGRLVGITLFVPEVSDRHHRIGFAVPSHRAKRIARDLNDRGQVHRMMIGVQVSRVDPEEAALLGFQGAVRVDSVVVDGPASQAGLVPGDQIVLVDGRPITTLSDLISRVEFASDDHPMTLEIVRDGRRESLNIQPKPIRDSLNLGAGPMVVTPRPADSEPAISDDPTPSIRLPEPATARDPTRFPSLGLRLGETSPALTQRFGLDEDVSGVIIVGITPGGPADLGGLEPGMVVTDVLDRRVRSLAEFRESVAIAPTDRDLILRVRHRGRSEFRVLLRDLRQAEDQDHRFPCLND